MAYQLQLRRDTSVNWSSIDPILAQGEPGYELDTGKIKYGDGVTLWSALPYFTSGGSGGNTTPGGPINSVQFNANGSFSGSSLLTIDIGNSNIVSTGTIVSQYFVGDGSQLSNIPTSNLSSVSNDIIPSANITYSLGNSTNQWKELWVSGNTIYLGGLPLSKNANGNITYDDQELIAQSNTGQTSITNLTSEDANITNIVSDNISSENIIAAFIAGDGSNITNINYNNIIDAYSNANVASYLPNNVSNVAAAYFIGDGSQLTNLPVSGNYSNANVAAYLPNYDGDVLANIVIANGIHTGSNITPGAYYFDVTDDSVVFGTAASQGIVVNSSGIEISGTAGVKIAGINLANVTIGDATGGHVNIINPINLGPIGNVTIDGGNSGEILATYGNGTLYWTVETTYGNGNVATYLPTYDGDFSANTTISNTIFVGNNASLGDIFLNVTNTSISMGQFAAQSINLGGSGIQIGGTGGVTLFGVANANVNLGGGTTDSIVASSPIIAGNVIADYFIGDGSQLNNLPVLDNYSNTNVAAYLPTYTGNLVGLTGEVITTANIDCTYILGNGAFLTGIEMAIGSYSNANVNSYLPIYSGNISADVITTNSINSEIVQFGNANANICTQSWVTAQSSSLSNITLYQIPASDVASIDFNIIATSNNNRQVCKLVTVVINTSFEYSEYGSLNIGPLLGNFTIDLVGGNLLLNVEPFTSNTIDYTVVFTTYNS